MTLLALLIVFEPMLALSPFTLQRDTSSEETQSEAPAEAKAVAARRRVALVRPSLRAPLVVLRPLAHFPACPLHDDSQPPLSRLIFPLRC
jgi:hypothetical protein